MFEKIILFSCLAVGNLYCTDSSCTSCISNYVLLESSCLSVCPTGYDLVQASNSCQVSSSAELFYLAFYRFLQFTASSIGDFQNSSGLSFNDSSQSSPIPTKDRGFYFPKGSQLYSTTSWIIAPSFSLSLYINILEDGEILKFKINNTTIIKLKSISGVLNFSALYTDCSSNKQYIKSIYYTYTSNWNYLVIYHNQKNNSNYILFNNVVATPSAYEFRADSDAIAVIGGSFKGFISQLLFLNTFDIYTYLFNALPTCISYQFYSSTSCNNCTTNTWPWCVRNASNSICYSANCSSCIGYGYSECLACSNGNIAPDCSTNSVCKTSAGTFNCTSCTSSHTLIDGLCLRLPYKYNVSALNTPIVNINFANIAQFYGDLFQSGANSATYSPFNNPEADDPLSVKSRGIYFNGVSSYLTTNTSISLNYKFSLAFWTYAMNDKRIFHANGISLHSSGYYMISLGAIEENQIYLLSDKYTLNINQWSFYSLTIGFVSGTTNLIFSINLVESFNSYDGDYYDNPSGILALASNSNGYQGFMYSFVLWNTDIYDFSDQYNVCGTNLNATCLWNCSVDQYYNSLENECSSCDSTCTAGCSTWASCNQCLNQSCGVCTNFNSTCISNGYNPCLNGFVLNQNNQCCLNNCDNCNYFDVYECIRCAYSYLLLNQICVSECPPGYIETAGSCISSLNPIINITLNEIQDKVIDANSGIIFSTGVNTEFYPSGTSSDPIPVMGRGYYFNSTSYMTSSEFMLPFNFTITFFIKAAFTSIASESYGIILTKNNLQICLQSSLITLISGASYNFTWSYPTVWSIFNVYIYANDTGIIINGISENSKTYVIGSNFFQDSLSTLILGNDSNSFTGFLWNFQIYSTIITSTSFFSLTLCNSSITTNCLWNCDLNQYFNGANCQNCNQVCTHGCRSSSTCSLCANPICLNCSDYESGCTECYESAIFIDNQCTCNNNYYWNSSTLKCENCDISCKNCTGYGNLECTSCNNNAALYTNGSCLCVTGHYWNGSLCNSCDKTCLNCSGSQNTNCINCPLNSELQINNECVCIAGYYWNNSCIYNSGFFEGSSCDKTCLTCSGNSFYECLSCSNYLLNIVCLSSCPLGYYKNMNKCMQTSTTTPAIKYLFDDIQSIYLDKIQQLPAKAGSNNSTLQNLDSTDPIPAYQRGLYFTGNGSYLSLPYQKNGILLLGMQFYISIWLNPYSLSNQLLFKGNSSSLIYSSDILNLNLITKIKLNNIHYSFPSSNSLILKEWNHALLITGYAKSTTISFVINNHQDEIYTADSPFMDYIDDLLYVGSNSLFSEFFKGFIYSIEIYLNYPQLSSIVAEGSCGSCNVCLPSNACIPNCNITMFINQSTLECSSCPLECKNGCKHNNNCNLCQDAYCISCTSYDQYSCITCISGYELINSACFPCNSLSYYDTATKTCKICTNLCDGCVSEYNCTSCKENSFLNLQNECVCNKGYNLSNGICIRNQFDVILTISSTNIVTLAFTDTLEYKLSNNVFLLSINGLIQKFTVVNQDNSTVLLIVDFIANVNQGDKLLIQITELILSTSNSILLAQNLTTALFATSISTTAIQAAQVKTSTKAGMAVGASAAIGMSLLNANPTSFFTFLNSAEIFSYIVVYQVNIDPTLIAFLNSLQTTSMIPNIFQYMLSDSQGVQYTGKLQDFGFNSNITLINFGPFLTTLIIFMFGLLVCFLLKYIKYPYIQLKVMRLINYYHYGFFLRFWIQSCLGLTFCSVVGIFYSNFANPTQVIDASFSIILIVLSR